MPTIMLLHIQHGWTGQPHAPHPQQALHFLRQRTQRTHHPGFDKQIDRARVTYPEHIGTRLTNGLQLNLCAIAKKTIPAGGKDKLGTYARCKGTCRCQSIRFHTGRQNNLLGHLRV